jgi:hypothetical protein
MFIPPDQHTSGRPKRDRGIGCGLRQSIHRLAAGQRVLTAMTPCPGTVKVRWDADLRQFQEARLCAAPGRSQRRAVCNRGSTQAIAGSRIRYDGSKYSVALLRLAKELHQKLAQEA